MEHLRAILRGPYAPALAEWLDGLARTGRVLGPELLRSALDRGSADPEIALRLEGVLPERARWLAAQHGDWDWAAGGDLEERWETGSRQARLHVLRVTRRDDPERARELVASTFDTDAARERQAFLAVLADGLSAADEPLLERALSVRQADVRAQAARLLSGLPGSPLSERMAARLDPLISTTRLRRLAVELPGPITDELRGDGFDAKPPSGTGKQAWVLHQLVAAAPLRVWERLDADPAKLLARRVEDDMAELLRSAWSEAAVRQRDARWAAALLDRGAAPPRVAARLIALAPANGEPYVAALLGTPAGDALADALPRPWSRAFTARVAERLDQLLAPGRWAAALGRDGDPALADRLAAADPDTLAGRRRRDAAGLLAFRRTMFETLQEIT
jgi:hypothetical protein